MTKKKRYIWNGLKLTGRYNVNEWKKTNLYIPKNWSITSSVIIFQLSNINVHVIIFFLSNFPIIVFNIFFLIFTFLQPLSLSYFFISPLPSTLISFFLFLFIFLYFCLFLFTPSYYKFVTISYILCTVFPHKKKGPLSLSLSHFFSGFFYLSCISTLGW